MFNAKEVFKEEIEFINGIKYKTKDPYKLEPVTDEDITKVEDLYGFKLPQSYIDLIKQQNGGYLKNQFLMLNKEKDEYLVIEAILGIKENEFNSISGEIENLKENIEGLDDFLRI